MRAASLLVVLGLLAACVPAGSPGASGDVGEEDLGPLRGLAGCAAKPGTLTCRALLAFAGGRVPTAGAPSAYPGAITVIPAPGSPEAGQPPIVGAGYLILGANAATFQILVPSNDAERTASQELVQRIADGAPLPAENATVAYARSRTGARPATVVGRSLAWSGDTQGFARETNMGVVVVERSPAVIMVGVFPR